MNRALGNTSKSSISWFWLVLLLSSAVLAEVAAVRAADIGIAISGIGMAVLAAFGFLCPLPLNSNWRAGIRQASENVPPGVAILGGIGGFLNVVGVLLRWLG